MRSVLDLLRRRRQPAEHAQRRLTAGYVSASTDGTPAPQPLYQHERLGQHSNHPDQLATDSLTARLLLRKVPLQTPSQIWRSPETHAQRLVEWLADHWPGEVLAREVQGAYREMCSDIGWEPAAWNRVAPRFRELINDRKHYHDVVVNGHRHRRCFYSFPCRLADDPSAARNRLAAGREPDARLSWAVSVVSDRCVSPCERSARGGALCAAHDDKQTLVERLSRCRDRGPTCARRRE